MSLNAQVYRRTHRRSNLPWLLTALVIVAAAAGLVGTTALRASQITPPPKQTCTPPPPKGASPAAVAFLDAVAAVTPKWQQIDANLARQDNVTRHADLNGQLIADGTFLASLRAISYPPQARSAATALMKALQSYLSFLQTAYTHQGYLAKHPAADEKLTYNRATTLADLRTALGIAPAECVFRLP